MRLWHFLNRCRAARISSTSVFCAQLVLAIMFSICCASPGLAGILQAVSYGEGKIALSWPPSVAQLCGGSWVLVDADTGVTVAEWGPKDLAEGLLSLPAEQQQRLRSFIESMPSMAAEEQKQALGGVLMGALGDFPTAVKLGFGVILEGVASGKHGYRLVVKDAGNREVATGTGGPVDGWDATAMPHGAKDLRAESLVAGVKLFWRVPEQPLWTPFALVSRAHRAQREMDEINLTPTPVWMADGSEQKDAAFADQDAPLESELIYTVRLQDVFGRISDPVEITVYHADAEALRPPAGVTAKPGKQEVELTWERNENPFTAGYVIERSRRASGIYEVLTPSALNPSEERFLDQNVPGGFTYHYRIRSVGPRGDVGSASDPVAVMTKSDDPPDPPKGLSAEVKPSFIRLSWEPRTLPVAGYIVERKQGEDGVWVRLHPGLVSFSQYDDAVSLGDFGMRFYRVSAVAFGNIQSDLGDEIKVDLAGHAPVPSPFLSAARWDGGKVMLEFKAAPPEDRTVTMLLVRGNSPTDEGMVIASEIAGSATAFEDQFVKPGEDYWYALIGVGEQGRLSKMGNKRSILTGSLTLPEPEKPQATFDAIPFKRVVITFAKPDGNMHTVVMRRAGSGPWVTISRDVGDVEEIVDADPPRSGLVGYRIAYIDESGAWSPPSEETTLTIK